jgi:hypothetical protein
MKLIAIETGKRQNGEFVLLALREATAHGRAALEDVALAYRDGAKVHVKHTKGRTSRLFGDGIDNHQVEQILASREAESFVFALGTEVQVEAVARRVRTIGEDDFPTYDVEGTELRETTARDATYALDDAEVPLLHEPDLGSIEEGSLNEQMNRR